MTATEPKAVPPVPPRNPPTATAGAMKDDAAFGLVVPIPPGWQVGALEFVVPADTGRPAWRRTLQTHAVDSCGSPMLRAVCESAIPAHATALAVASAWAQFQSEHPSGSEAAAQRGCRVPHPQPAGGIRTQTLLRMGDEFPIRVTFPNALTLIDSVPELVRLDGGRRPAWYSEAADAEAITEHGIFPEPYRPDPAGTFPESYLPPADPVLTTFGESQRNRDAARSFLSGGASDVDQMEDFLKGRGPVPGDTVDAARRRAFVQGEPMTVPLTFNLSAVAEDFDGKVKPIADLSSGTTSFGGTVVRVNIDEEATAARMMAAVLNQCRDLEAELARRVREIANAAAGKVSYSTAPGEGWVPAYPIRRRAENLCGPAHRDNPGWIRLPVGFITRVDVDSDSGAVPCTVCRLETTVRYDGPPPVMLSSFYRRSETDRPG